MALTVFNIKKYLLFALYLTHYENVNAGRLVLTKNSGIGYLSTDGLYEKYYSLYGDTPPSIGYYGTPSVGGYYYTSPLPPTIPSPPPIPKKTKKSTNALALGLGLGLGLGVPSVIAGVAYWIYKHPSVLPWMWRPL